MNDDPNDTGTEVLVSAAQLLGELASARPPVLLDVRWRLDRPDGHPDYLAGHLPGAVYVDLDRELAAPGAPDEGRHPLPSREALEASARRWGIRQGDRVVVYDDLKGMSAARAWWLLKDAGIAQVRILDGGYRAWVAAGGQIATGEVTSETGDVVLSEGRMPRVDADGAAAMPAHGVLLDARAGERYRGESEPIDPRAGHIPGARNRPTADNLAADGTFLPASVLRDAFAALGVDGSRSVAVYCGSGVTAAHEIAALAVAGIPAALYPGSWSQWAHLADRPLAVGATPDSESDA